MDLDYIIEYIKDASKNNNTMNVLTSNKKNLYIPKAPKIEKADIDIYDYLKFGDKFNRIIFEYNNILEDELENYKSLFNRNIRTLKVDDYKLRISALFRKYNAFYDSKNNIIKLNKNMSNDYDKFRRVFMHELTHMTTGYDLIFCGFATESLSEKGPISLGNALNEGYTEYLNQKYFAKRMSKSYENQIVMARMIEKIIGENEMLSAYFNCDLTKVISFLRIYSRDLTLPVDILLEMDKFDKSKYKKIRKDLATIYNKKIDNMLINNRISVEEYEREKFLHVDRFIEDNIFYDDDCVIEENKDYYVIADYNNRTILKKNFELKFQPDKSTLAEPKLVLKKNVKKER